MRRLHWLLSALLFMTTSCGGAVATATYELECETGTLGCNCYGNWSCNYQLSCVDEVCIDRKSLPAEELDSSESSPADPLAAAASDECLECLQESCAAPLEACYPETGCIAFQACLLACANSDKTHQECNVKCSNDTSVNAQLKSRAVSECHEQRCGMCSGSTE